MLRPFFVLVGIALVIGTLAAQGQAPDDEERKYRRAATLKGLAVAEMEEGNYGVVAGYLECGWV